MNTFGIFRTTLPVLLSLIQVCLGQLLLAQDVILKTDGTEVMSQVVEITSQNIRYREVDHLDGPLRNVPLSEVLSIIYENGRKETFMAKQQAEAPGSVSVPVGNQAQPSNMLSVGLGAGRSYGGLGVQLQYIPKGQTRVALHGGIGYHLEGEQLSFSIGSKLYLFKGLYIDAQFGLFNELPQETTIVSPGYYCNYMETYTTFYDAWGSSLMLGMDWFFSDHIGLNVASGLTVDVVNFAGSIFFAGDVGLLYRF